MANRRIRLPTTISEGAVRAWSATLAVALTILVCTWVFGVPRYGAPDELAHTTKAYGTVHGETIGSPVADSSPLTRNFDVPAGLISADPACFAFYPEVTASCAVAVNDAHPVQYATSAATYPPEYYAVVGGIARLLGTDQSVASYRLISALIGTLLLTLALTLMRRAGGRKAALALVALNPMTLFIVASTNPASTELAGSLLLWAYVAVLLTGERVAGRRQLLLASTIAAVIVLVRPVALPWVAIALAGYLLLERRPYAADRRSTTRLFAVCSIPLVVAVAASSAWSRYAGVGLTDDKYLVTDSTVAIFRAGIGRTSELFEQAFGWLGWLDTELPTPAYALWIVCLVLIGVIVAFSTDRRIQLTLVAIGLIWVLYPAIYVTLAKTPMVWQGRYNLPLLGGVVLCGLLSTPPAHSETLLARQAISIARFCAASWVIIEVVAFYQTLRRFMVGAAGSVLLRGGWHPPINAYLLLLANAATAIVIAWLMTRT
ncbi:MAG TPA: DUF2142 domain-containing protein, partial [Ilumatobacteraceae bacterium]|nr:DUF2142 domain-containing protein [Ilumatobacteraceae bacterium]